jgi:hypothetical protein
MGRRYHAATGQNWGVNATGRSSLRELLSNSDSGRGNKPCSDSRPHGIDTNNPRRGSGTDSGDPDNIRRPGSLTSAAQPPARERQLLHAARRRAPSPLKPKQTATSGASRPSRLGATRAREAGRKRSYRSGQQKSRDETVSNPRGSCRAPEGTTGLRDGVIVFEGAVHHRAPNLEHQVVSVRMWCAEIASCALTPQAVFCTRLSDMFTRGGRTDRITHRV